jgi:hypothetical protein
MPKLSIVGRALDRVVNSDFSVWCGADSDPPGERIDILSSKLFRNLVVWYVETPAAYKVLETYYLSNNASQLIGLMMFLYIGAKTGGGLAGMDMHRDIARAFLKDMDQYMSNCLKDTVSEKTKKSMVIMLKKNCNLITTELREIQHKVTDKQSTGYPLPEADVSIARYLGMITNISVRIMILNGDTEANMSAMMAMRKFAEGVDDSDSDSSTSTDETTLKTDEDILELKAMSADNRARALEAEETAEAALKRAVASEKKVVILERKIAALVKSLDAMSLDNKALSTRVSEINSRLDATTSDAMEKDVRAEMADLRRHVDMVSAIASRAPKVVKTVKTPPPPPPLPTPPTPPPTPPVVELGPVHGSLVDHAEKLRKLRLEMDWILPQFQLQFCQAWNSLVAQWNMQQELGTSDVAAPELRLV